MVHLSHNKASAIAVLLLLFFLFAGCTAEKEELPAVVEANPLQSGIYHIEIIGNNGIATLAYKSDVLNIGDQTQWDGLATIGAYDMAFRQECHSVYSPSIKAKLWRNRWVSSTATSPKDLVLSWLQSCTGKASEYDPNVVAIATVLPAGEEDTRRVYSVTLPSAVLEWNALCDAHIDTLFGSQAFLTDVKTGTVILYFDAETNALAGVKITAQHGRTALSATITVSTADGQNLREFPETEDPIKGSLSEEWNFIEEDDNNAG